MIAVPAPRSRFQHSTKLHPSFWPSQFASATEAAEAAFFALSHAPVRPTSWDGFDKTLAIRSRGRLGERSVDGIFSLRAVDSKVPAIEGFSIHAPVSSSLQHKPVISFRSHPLREYPGAPKISFQTNLLIKTNPRSLAFRLWFMLNVRIEECGGPGHRQNQHALVTFRRFEKELSGLLFAHD
jgi:hypothetical protein